jgi:hypothetical protein
VTRNSACFDTTFYKAANADLVKQYGAVDDDVYVKHFIFEGQVQAAMRMLA